MADLRVPPLGESITEAVIAKWLKSVGDAIAKDEPVVELETDKITVQIPAPEAGALSEQKAKEGDTVKVGDLVGVVAAGAAGAAKAAPVAAPVKPAPVATPAPTPAPAPIPTPVAAKPAPVAVAAAPAPAPALDKDALLKLPPSQRMVARETGALPQPAGNGRAAAAPAPAPERAIEIRPGDDVVQMSPLRKRIAERLVQAQHETASLTTFNEIDMSAVMALRARYKDTFEKQHGVKLGFMSLFVKACVAAAKLWPGLNAEMSGHTIVYKKHYDFGIAVSTPKGLVVPVLRDCDTRSLAEIEKGIAELADKARNAKLAIEDLTGGTFSITNGGIYGSMMSTPLLNYPQTGILGMHNIVKRAVVVPDAGGDKVEVRPMMYVALSYDHRVVDGREAVSFLVAVKERLEAPERLLLEV
jgi:2-oxoglutarate dehydrogenase E2 component (dihydrolipoamide succinyltransferase)